MPTSISSSSSSVHRLRPLSSHPKTTGALSQVSLPDGYCLRRNGSTRRNGRSTLPSCALHLVSWVATTWRHGAGFSCIPTTPRADRSSVRISPRLLPAPSSCLRSREPTATCTGTRTSRPTSDLTCACSTTACRSRSMLIMISDARCLPSPHPTRCRERPEPILHRKTTARWICMVWRPSWDGASASIKICMCRHASDSHTTTTRC